MSNETLKAIASVVRVLLIVSFGAALKRYYRFSATTLRDLVKISTNLFVPSLVFSSVVSGVTARIILDTWIVPLSALIQICLVYFLSWMVSHFFIPRKYTSLVVISSTFCNGMIIPLSVIRGLGEQSAALNKHLDYISSLAFIYSVFQGPIFWSLAPVLVELDKKRERVLEAHQKERAGTTEMTPKAISQIQSVESTDITMPSTSIESVAPVITTPHLTQGILQQNTRLSGMKVSPSLAASEQHPNHEIPDNQCFTAENLQMHTESLSKKPKGKTLRGFASEDGVVPHDVLSMSSVMFQPYITEEAEKTFLGNVIYTLKSFFDRARRDRRLQMLSYAINAPMIAILLGLVCALIPPLRYQMISTSGWFNTPFSALSQVGEGAIPMILVVLGANLWDGYQNAGECKIPKKVIAVSLFFKLLFTPFFFLMLWTLLHKPMDISPYPALVILIESASPIAINCSLIFSMHDHLAREAATVTLCGYVSCVVTVSAWLAIYLWLLQI